MGQLGKIQKKIYKLVLSILLFLLVFSSSILSENRVYADIPTEAQVSAAKKAAVEAAVAGFLANDNHNFVSVQEKAATAATAAGGDWVDVVTIAYQATSAAVKFVDAAKPLVISGRSVEVASVAGVNAVNDSGLPAEYTNLASGAWKDNETAVNASVAANAQATANTYEDMAGKQPPEKFSTYYTNLRTSEDGSWTTAGKIITGVATVIGMVVAAPFTAGGSVIVGAGIIAGAGLVSGAAMGGMTAGIDALTPSKMSPCGNSSKFLGLFDFGAGAVCGVVLILHDQGNTFLFNMVHFLATSVPEYQAEKAFYPLYAYGFSGAGSTLGRLMFNMTPDFLSKPIQDEMVEDAGMGKLVRNVEKTVRTMVLSVLIIVLIGLAIMNILQININTYAVKKTLPGLLIGFIVSYFSFFAIRASLEVVGVVTKGVLSNPISVSNNPGTGDKLGIYNYIVVLSTFPLSLEKVGYPCAYNYAYMTSGVSGDEAEPSVPPGYTAGIKCRVDGNVDWGKVNYMVLKTITMFIGGAMAFVLGFIFLLRRFIFYFLIPLAPLAIMGAFFKPLDSVWQKWKKTFTGWLLMPLASSFWLWLGLSWFKAYDPISGYESGSNNSAQIIVSFAFGMTCLYMAIKTPFSMAGEASAVMNKWSSMGKKAWGSTGGAAIKAGGNMIKSGAKAVGTNIKEEAKYQMLEKTPAGTIARGMAQRKKNIEERRKGAMTGPVMRGQGAVAQAVNNRFAQKRQNIEHIENEKKADEALNTANAKDRFSVSHRAELDLIRDKQSDAKRVEQTTVRRENLQYLNGNGNAALSRTRLSREATAVNEEERYKKDTEELLEGWDTSELARLKVKQANSQANAEDVQMIGHLTRKGIKRQRDNDYSFVDLVAEPNADQATLDKVAENLMATANIVINERMATAGTGDDMVVADGEMKKLKAVTRMIKEMTVEDSPTRISAIEDLRIIFNEIERINGTPFPDHVDTDRALSNLLSTDKAIRQRALLSLNSTNFGAHLVRIKSGVPITHLGV